ncbi:hybrid sensor histidine kinase/response regulator [Rugamonas apoptosis]|uniref:Virulence sensor protein BvgS n=1 Tax=Rugamonas apoptosis TaxID=2758570 RepID=A0A7W2FEX6_9BURK|nr:hybrid sensor histidine kinase/response regulator [Rugamonas apoptosis]MBA5690354.1 response regulator [Rugamonas apoptosis]
MSNRYPRASRVVIAAGAVLIGAMLAGCAALIWLARQQAIDEWRVHLSNLSLVLAEQTSQEVTAAYLVLDSIAEAVQTAEVDSPAELRERMGTATVYASMRDKKRAAPQIDVATLVADNGDVINFTRSHPAPPINLADRDYFQAHLHDPALGVFISAPVRNKGNGAWTFYLSKRLANRQGKLIGIALVGFSSTFVSDFYKKISLGPDASISLYRRDFTLLASWPHVDANMGKVNRTGSSYTLLEKMGLDHGVLVTSQPRFSQGGAPVLRMGAPRRVEPYPLIINITITDQLFLGQWRQYAFRLGAMGGLGMAAVGLAFAFLLRAVRRREQDMALMQRLQTEAEAASRTKSDFLAMMSHELRTPLTAIIGFADLLQTAQQLPEAHDAGKIIARSGQHLLAILNDMLDLSKVEAGRLQLEQVPFSPYDIVAGIRTALEPQAHSKGIAFICTVHYPLPGQVLGDPTRWRQILYNLCGNAVKFTELGTITLTLSYDAARELLVCGVQDTGIGMSGEHLATLFQPFKQADASTARKYGGTGLGLYLVQQLATRMQGTVQVASTLGQGTSFTVSVPAAPAAAAWLACAPHPPAAPPQLDVPHLHGRVLLAEDGADNRKLIGVFLERCGLAVTMVENGQEAVESALRDGYDLILMDIQMPVLDGLEATSLLRAAGYGGPIVALTANVMREDVARYRDSGCNGHLAKPIDFRLLAQQLAQWLAAAPPAADAPPVAGYAAQCEAYGQDLPARLDALQHALAAGMLEEAARLAHMLKGSAGAFGLADAGTLAGAIERAAGHGDAARAQHALDQINQLVTVRQWRAAGASHATS